MRNTYESKTTFRLDGLWRTGRGKCDLILAFEIEKRRQSLWPPGKGQRKLAYRSLRFCLFFLCAYVIVPVFPLEWKLLQGWNTQHTCVDPTLSKRIWFPTFKFIGSNYLDNLSARRKKNSCYPLHRNCDNVHSDWQFSGIQISVKKSYLSMAHLLYLILFYL